MKPEEKSWEQPSSHHRDRDQSSWGRNEKDTGRGLQALGGWGGYEKKNEKSYDTGRDQQDRRGRQEKSYDDFSSNRQAQSGTNMTDVEKRAGAVRSTAMLMV